MLFDNLLMIIEVNIDNEEIMEEKLKSSSGKTEAT